MILYEDLSKIFLVPKFETNWPNIKYTTVSHFVPCGTVGTYRVEDLP